MRKLATILIIGLVLVPWPVWVDALVFRPYFNTMMTPEEASGASLLMSIIVVYTAIFLIAAIIFRTIDAIEKRFGNETPMQHMLVAHDAGAELSEPERRKYERERQGRKKKAREDGALLILLAELSEDDTKRR